MSLEMVARIDCSMTFPGKKSKTEKPEVPWILLLVLLEDESDFCSLSVLRSLLELLWSLKGNQKWPCNGNSLLLRCWCMMHPISPMDLCVSGLFNVLQPSLSPLRVNLHCFKLYLWYQSWRSVLPFTEEVKKALNTLMFSVSFITESPAPPSNRPKGTFLIALHQTHQAGFAFLNPILAHQ